MKEKYQTKFKSIISTCNCFFIWCSFNEKVNRKQKLEKVTERLGSIVFNKFA